MGEMVRTSALVPRAIDLTELLTEPVEVLARRVVGVVYDLDGSVPAELSTLCLREGLKELLLGRCEVEEPDEDELLIPRQLIKYLFLRLGCTAIEQPVIDVALCLQAGGEPLI